MVIVRPLRPVLVGMAFCVTWWTTHAAEEVLTSTPPSWLSKVSSTFSDISGYDVYHHAGSPLGLLDIEDASVRLVLGHRYLGWEDERKPDSASEKTGGFVLPAFTVGRPGSVYFTMGYEPSNMSRTTDTVTLSIPLNRFGFGIVGQTRSKLFRIGFLFHGYYGKSEADTGSDTRVSGGIDDVSLHLGSQIHELVRLGFWGRGTADGDSLKADRPYDWEDRYFSGNIPSVGWYFDFGKSDFPVLSNFAFSYTRNHFVYVVKSPFPSWGIAGRYGTSGSRDAIVSDSLEWQWQTMVDLNLHGFRTRPAILFGYWRSAGRLWVPKGDNYPTQYEKERTGYDWRLSSFRFGLGASCAVRQYGTAWLEFSRSSFDLEMSDSMELRMAGDLSPQQLGEFDPSRGFVRFGVGLESYIHALPGVSFPEWLELAFRFGVLSAAEPVEYDGYRTGEFRQLNTMSIGSQVARYRPYLSALGERRVSNVSFGLGAGFLDRMVELDLHLGVLKRTTELASRRTEKGIEFGVDVAYCLRKKPTASQQPSVPAPSQGGPEGETTP